MANERGSWGSNIGFLLAAIGSAVGLGNIWGFPYKMGKSGGFTFLLIYLLLAVFVGFVIMMGELAMGRKIGKGTVGAYHALSKKFKWVGWLAVFSPFVIMSFYSVLGGYCIEYMALNLSNLAFAGAEVKTGADLFGAMLTNPFGCVAFTLLFLIICYLINRGGVSGGIEKINKVMMPAFFILFIIIAVRVAFLPNAIEGYKYLLVPQWEYLLNPRTWIMAMGQAFFSLSITGSGMIIYGSYLPKNEDVVHSSCMTAVLDTCAAMLAGFAILPSVFAFGLDPASGPKLLFITLPRVFQQMPFGRLFAFFFFISVLFAGITSLANMLEAVSEAAQTRLKLSRKAAVLLACGAALAVGLFIERDALMGTLMDVITIYVVPIGAILGAVMAYWVLGIDKMEQELMNGRSKPLSRAFAPLAKYVYIFLAALVVFFSFIIPGGIG